MFSFRHKAYKQTNNLCLVRAGMKQIFKQTNKKPISIVPCRHKADKHANSLEVSVVKGEATQVITSQNIKVTNDFL